MPVTMKLKTLSCCVAAVAVLAGCSSSGNGGQAATTSGTSGAPARKQFRITMIAKSDNNPVFQAAKTGAEAAAVELGKQNETDIHIDWRTPPTEDGEEQARRIAQAVNDGTDAILISCSNAAKVTGAINDAVAKGVPVMTFDSDAPDSKRFSFYGADDLSMGEQIMDELAKVTGGKGNVQILAGNQDAPNLQNRKKGVEQAAKKYPGIKIVGTSYHTETPQDAAQEVTRSMNANPSIDAWAMVGGWPLFGTSLLTLDPNKVAIVSADALPEELAYVDKGVVPVLIAQPVYEWGYKSVGIIVDKVLLKQDVPTINKMDLVRVSKDNLELWAKQLKAWGFTVDEKYLKSPLR
jgi:ribose transport system substrate-binding protein